jgi:hypothetical protein
MLNLSLRSIAWFFAVWVLGWYVFSVEAALFAPPQWYLSDILTPVRMAVVAWAVVSFFLILESVMKKPIQPHELLIRTVSFLLSLSFTYTLMLTELGGGAYWSLYGKNLGLTMRVLIGIVFGLAWAYVVASPWVVRDKWIKVGEVGIDTGTLLITDPVRAYGELPSFEELGGLKESDRVVSTLPMEGKKPKGWTDEMASHACQVLFKEGHEGAGVTVDTGVGDGQYFVYARMGKIKGVPERFRNLAKLERLAGVKVEFTPWRPNKEPPPRRKEERARER